MFQPFLLQVKTYKLHRGNKNFPIMAVSGKYELKAEMEKDARSARAACANFSQLCVLLKGFGLFCAILGILQILP